MIISFGWTTPALIAGCKQVTRRDWNPKHAARFKAGMLIDAWNTSPRNVRGKPHKVALIRLTADPYLEDSAAFDVGGPDDEAEGFQWLIKHGHGETVGDIIEGWLSRPRPLYVVRFEVVEFLHFIDPEEPEKDSPRGANMIVRFWPEGFQL